MMRLYSLSDAAKQLGIGYNRLRVWRKKGLVNASMVAGKCQALFSDKDIDKIKELLSLLQKYPFKRLPAIETPPVKNDPVKEKQ